MAATLYTLLETAKFQHVAPTRHLLESMRAGDRAQAFATHR